MSDDNRETLLTSKQLAKRVGYNEGSLRNMRSEGRGIPYIKRLNGRVSYQLRDVIAWEQAGLA